MSENEKKPTGRHEALQALKFTLFSISAGIIQISTYTLFYEVFHWAPWLAYLVSLILSVLWNFTFNRKYTFRSDADLKKSMPEIPAPKAHLHGHIGTQSRSFRNDVTEKKTCYHGARNS